MMKKYLYGILLLLLATSCSDSIEKIDEKETIQTIQNYMDEQMNSWNNGDIPGFMEHYWHSDSLLFIGKNGVTEGWQSTLDNYLEGYSDTAAMGTLLFENKTIRLLDNETVQVIGKWSLERDPELGNISGHYSLIWQRKEGKWVIISDHSS
jgi:hypothetical protein